MAHPAHAEAAHDDRPHGITRWLFSTNHKDIGTMYLILALIGGIVGGLLSMGMRAELMQPGMQIFTNPEVFNVFVTGPRPDHGVLHGHAVDHGRVRQLDGAADDRRAGHGLPAHEQHLVLAGRGGPCHARLLFVRARTLPAPTASAAAGRSMRRSRPAARPARPWTWPSSSLHLAGASSILGAINFITTIFNMRAPGMTLHKMPLFVWAVLVTAFLLLLVACRCSPAPSPCC